MRGKAKGVRVSPEIKVKSQRRRNERDECGDRGCLASECATRDAVSAGVPRVRLQIFRPVNDNAGAIRRGRWVRPRACSPFSRVVFLLLLSVSLFSLSLYIYIHLAALGQLAFYKSTIASGGATILLTFIQLNTIVTRYATRVNKNARGIDVHWLFHPSVRSGG